MTGPLSDLRLVELGQLLAGPYCGQLLGDYGAEVIKIEDPKRGDPLRDWGQEKAHGKSLWWPIAARNKKCVTADLRTPEGQQIVKELVEQSDMLLENFRPGTLERWGLGYDVLSKINPGLILIRVSGYGQTGPYAPRPGYASVGEAMGGLRYVIGEPDRMPARAGISLGDSLAATFATLGALAALHSKEKTGKGQVIDASIYESVMAYMESLIPEWAIGGYQRERTGSVLPKITPSNVYPTKSGEMLLIAANMDTVFKRLAHAMGKPELADDPKYASILKKMRQQMDEWQQKFPDKGGIPEKELIKEWWNGDNKPPITTLPRVTKKNGKLQLICPTAAASIGWRNKGEKSWNVYSEPINTPTQTIEFIAMRIGYLSSEIGTY